MKPTSFIAALAFAAALPTAPTALAHDHGHGRGHQTYSAGEPGDPAKPSRTIEIEMSEMDYNPFKIEVKRGEKMRFVLRNVGTEDHEFLLATTKENLKHGEEDGGDRVEVHETRQVRILPPDPQSSEYGMTGHVTLK